MVVVAQPVRADVNKITAVELNPTKEGIEVILNATDNKPLQVFMSSYGNTFVVNIVNTQLQLPDSKVFRQENPIAGIAAVTVNASGTNSIRVVVTGKTELPQAQVRQSDRSLTLSLTPDVTPTAHKPTPKPEVSEAVQPETETETAPEVEEVIPTEGEAEQLTVTDEGEEDIEIVVTGEQETEYSVPNASTATRTDTPIRDIPQSIQVIPRQVLEDQQAIQLRDALRNVSGVVEGGNFGGTTDSFIIRGFSGATILRNGFRGTSYGSFASENALNETANLQRVEVLKGPASVLYGNAEPGGIINLVTKQPLSEPYYFVNLQAGSYDLYRPSVDLSGPLTSDRSLLYRLNAVYTGYDGFRDFDQDTQRFFISPVLTWNISNNTALTLELAYLDDERPMDRGIVAFGDGVADIPITRNLGELDDVYRVEQLGVRYQLEHRFSENLKLRNAFQYLVANTFDYKTQAGELDEATGIVSGREFDSNDDVNRSYVLQTDLTSEFATGSIQHTLLFGFDLTRQTAEGTNRGVPEGATPDINIFDPVYRGKPARSEFVNLGRDDSNRLNTLGIFLQDQIALLDNLKLLVGGRFDIADQKYDDRLADTTTDQSEEAFTPRVGLVYQPIEPISLYASYGRSFNPQSSTRVDGSFLEPERGTQYEVGIKADLNDSLSATLAAYQLTKTNIATTDPNNPDFSIPVGEVRSRGIELDVAGEILPGWNIIAAYAYTDSEVTESNDYPIGLKTALVPQNAVSLWTTYEIPSGDLQGLGFGLGLFYVDARPGDTENTYDLPSYLRTDAAIFYRRDNWRAAINIRNLFDVRYFESVNYGRSTVQPGAPLTVLGSFSVEF